MSCMKLIVGAAFETGQQTSRNGMMSYGKLKKRPDRDRTSERRRIIRI